jgi:hypothetical protein
MIIKGHDEEILMFVSLFVMREPKHDMNVTG